MKLKLIDIDERHLKDYLIVISHIKETAYNKIELLLNKLEGMSQPEEKEDIQKFLIEAHLKMVVGIANRYRGAGLSFVKLIKAGNKGLIKAVKTWGSDENEKFVPYLAWYIEGCILDEFIKHKNKEMQRKR